MGASLERSFATAATAAATAAISGAHIWESSHSFRMPQPHLPHFGELAFVQNADLTARIRSECRAQFD